MNPAGVPARIRSSTSGLVGAAALIAVVPGLLAAPEPAPLPDDVGLTGGATGAYAYAPVGPGPRDGVDRRRSAPRSEDKAPRPVHYRRPEPEPSPQRSDSGRSPSPAVIAAPSPPPPVTSISPTAGPAPPPATAAPPPAAPPTSPEPPDPPTPPAPPAEHDGGDQPTAPNKFGFER